MEFTRALRKGMSGEDVLFFKQKLLELAFYADHITSVSRSTFGADTLDAVKRFQTQAGLTVDGIVGAETWAKLFGTEVAEAQPVAKVEPPHLPRLSAPLHSPGLATCMFGAHPG